VKFLLGQAGSQHTTRPGNSYGAASSAGLPLLPAAQPPLTGGDGAVEGGNVTLGKPLDRPTYGWDNEYGLRTFEVHGFRASKSLIRWGPRPLVACPSPRLALRIFYI
jgi:hypothetical protein